MKRLILMLLVVSLAFTLITSCSAKPKADVKGKEPVVFRYGVRSQWPDSRNPYTSGWAISSTIYHVNHYESLLRLNPDLEQVGKLAESWNVDSTGTVWTIKLRPGVKWSDGQDLTANDVVFSYRAVIDNKLPRYYSETRDITEISAVDKLTVRIKTGAPRADYINMFIMEIVPEHVWNVNKTTDEFLKFYDPKLIGTGPFVFVDENIDEFVRYKANDNYWGGRPKIDELIYVFFANDDTKLQALEAGQIDVSTITAAQIDYAKNLKGITLHYYGTVSFTEMGFNMWQDPVSKGNPLIRDVKQIRQAIDYAINYDELIEFAKGGLARKEYGLIPSLAKPYAWTPDEKTMRKFSPEKARALLESAGFKNVGPDGIRSNSKGQKLNFRATVIEADYKDAALLIQKYCRDVGINFDITYVDFGRQGDIIEEQDFDTDIYFWGWTGDYEDPGFILSVVTTEQIGGRSDCWYSNPEYDKLYEMQSSIVDQKERLKVVYRMQEIIYEDCPYILLYSNKNCLAYNSDKWQGFIEYPRGIGSVLNIMSLANISRK